MKKKRVLVKTRLSVIEEAKRVVGSLGAWRGGPIKVSPWRSTGASGSALSGANMELSVTACTDWTGLDWSKACHWLTCVVSDR